MSNLDNLSDIDFEELCRDLAYAETGIRFSAFGPGPDGGIDGRHSKGKDSVILQCKHYSRSSFSNLMSSMKREAIKLSALKPKRYLLFTSQSLTINKSNILAEIIGEHLIAPEDVWGYEDIKASLQRNPEIEKAHIKLWLSSTAILERILNSGLEAFTQATKEEICEELRVYVSNPSFNQAIDKLESEKILVISGAPGVGKTTLAKMIAYYYLKDEWQFCAIRSLDEGFVKINDEKPTVFFFDDFLGRIQLDRQSLLQKDTAFATFIRRIRKTKNARFILTTRAHIFEEARNLSDHLDESRLQLSKYLLDVGSYTRQIKSCIFFNHLAISNLTQEHFAALLQDDWLEKIIDHKNYNPRTIASVSSNCLDKIEPTKYPAFVYEALQNPDAIWCKPYRALSISSQNLLISLYFGNQYHHSIEDLQTNFSGIHRIICSNHGQPTKPGDFEDSLRSLESGFIAIEGKTVRFINPSLRDFLKRHLANQEQLILLPLAAKRADWAGRLWSHVQEIFKLRPEILRDFALAFTDFASTIDATPTIKYYTDSLFRYLSTDDLSLSERVELLLEWWEHSKKEHFIKKALDLLISRPLPLKASLDGRNLPQLYWRIQIFLDDHPLQADLLRGVEECLLEILAIGVSTEELVSIVDAIKSYMDEICSVELEAEVDAAVQYEFDEIEDNIIALDERSLTEQAEYLDTLAELTGYDSYLAKEIIAKRLLELAEEEPLEKTLSFSSRHDQLEQKFDNLELQSLFSCLIK